MLQTLTLFIQTYNHSKQEFFLSVFKDSSCFHQKKKLDYLIFLAKIVQLYLKEYLS